MRDLVFRAWNSVADRFEIFTLASHDILTTAPIPSRGIWDDYEDWEQSTGLYDKNGERIFEGDILKLSEEYKVVVIYNDRTCAFACREMESEEPYCDHLYGAEFSEVIGNIHQNN